MQYHINNIYIYIYLKMIKMHKSKIVFTIKVTF